MTLEALHPEKNLVLIFCQRSLSLRTKRLHFIWILIKCKLVYVFLWHLVPSNLEARICGGWCKKPFPHHIPHVFHGIKIEIIIQTFRCQKVNPQNYYFLFLPVFNSVHYPAVTWTAAELVLKQFRAFGHLLQVEHIINMFLKNKSKIDFLRVKKKTSLLLRNTCFPLAKPLLRNMKLVQLILKRTSPKEMLTNYQKCPTRVVCHVPVFYLFIFSLSTFTMLPIVYLSTSIRTVDRRKT